MAPASARAGRLRAQLDGRRDGGAACRFTVTDDVWTITYGGRTVQAPDSKGLRDLHVLLCRAGVEVSAVDLFGREVPGGSYPLLRVGDAVLDDRARIAYRDRIAQLDEQIERALAAHHDGRAAELDAERDAIVAELRTATGLGGRPRRLGDDVERARKAVTARIRDAIRRLEGRHPPLAEHLRASVATGTVCRYQAAEPITWET